MMKRLNQKGVYAYLNSSGVLDSGTDAEIEEVRKRYWRIYKSEWRKKKRKECKEITLSLTQNELGLLKRMAKKYGLKPTQFIKESAISNLNKSNIIPHKLEIGYVKQMLGMIYNILAEWQEESKFSMSSLLLEKVSALEKEILFVLYTSKPIEQHIKEVLKVNPSYKAALLKFLQSIPENDCQIS